MPVSTCSQKLLHSEKQGKSGWVGGGWGGGGGGVGDECGHPAHGAHAMAGYNLNVNAGCMSS